MIPNNREINLSDHVDLFTKAKGTDKYICPICNGNDLSIHKSNGKYNCYSSAGDCNKEVFKFVNDLRGVDLKKNNYVGSQRKIGIDFYASDSLKEFANSTYEDLIKYQSGQGTQVKFAYENLKGQQCYVIRKKYPDGAKNKPYTVINNQFKIGKLDENWHPLNYRLFSEAKGKSIIITEGEKDAIITQKFTGILTTSLACGGNEYEQKLLFLALERVRIKSAVYFYDNDNAGENKAIKLKSIADKLEFDLSIIPIIYLYPNAQNKADISDFFLDDEIADYSKSKTHLESIVNQFKKEKSHIIKSAKKKEIDQSASMHEDLESDVRQIESNYTKSDDAIAENFLPKLFSQIVERLSDPLISEEDKQLQIGQFCSQHKINGNLIQKALDAKIKANEQTIAIDSFSADLTNLISVPNEKLDLNYIFGEFFGEAINSIATEIPTNPDAIATILLPVLASVLGTRSRIIVNPNTRYIVPLILRSMIVARSGAKKSPTLRLVTGPLDELNTLEYAKYKQNKKEYENSKDDDIKPPILKRLIVKDSTIDGLIKVHQDNPIGFLCEVDELSGYFKRMNKFHSGDDLQRDLELYEGKSLIKTRASDESDVFLPRTAISMVGTIQEVMLQQILADKDDLSGVSARCLIWAGEMPLGKAIKRNSNDDDGDDNTQNNFSDNLQTLLENLINQDIDSDLLIDDQAYELWRQWQNNIMDKLSTLSTPQLENKYSKIESDVIKFAGILHYFFLNVQPSLITNDNVINSEIMARAIILGNYYLRHFAYILKKCQEDELDSQLLKILELVQKKQEITAQDVKRFIREFKTTPISDINVLFLELIKLKKVEQISTQKGLKIKAL